MRGAAGHLEPGLGWQCEDVVSQGGRVWAAVEEAISLTVAEAHHGSTRRGALGAREYPGARERYGVDAGLMAQSDRRAWCSLPMRERGRQEHSASWRSGIDSS